MSEDSVGARGVNETAEKMGVNKSRVPQLTCSVFRKLRWPNHLKEMKEFIDEYSEESSRS